MSNFIIFNEILSVLIYNYQYFTLRGTYWGHFWTIKIIKICYISKTFQTQDQFLDFEMSLNKTRQNLNFILGIIRDDLVL